MCILSICNFLGKEDICMKYKTLGRTGLKVSEMGVGSTYFINLDEEKIISIFSESIRNGINYFDGVFYRDQAIYASSAIKGHRDNLILVGHLGLELMVEDYIILRDPIKARNAFMDFLEKMDLDYVDIIMIHNVGSKEVESIFIEGGLCSLAEKLIEEGYGRFVGISTHDTETCMSAIECNRIDVIMYPVNMVSHTTKGKQDINRACQEKNIGLVAMKPFAGGKLMQNNLTVYHSENNNYSRIKEDTWSKLIERKEAVSPLKCLSYVMNQPGVSCVVPGIKSVEELIDNLRYFSASEEELDFSKLMIEFKDYASGQCVYCNHCLPCPVKIDVANMNRRIDVALNELDKSERKGKLYEEAMDIINECIRCGECSFRCPFDVDVVAKVNGFPILYNDLLENM